MSTEPTPGSTSPNLTARQREVLSVIESFDSPPSLRELASRLNITSASGVVGHIKALEAKGYIEKSHTGARGIRAIPQWFFFVELIAEMASWYTQFNNVSNDIVIDMFLQPVNYSSVWKDFREAMPARIEHLKGLYRWRQDD